MNNRKRIKRVLPISAFLVVSIFYLAIAPFASAGVGQALYERWTAGGTADSMLTESSTPDYTEILTSTEWGVGDDDALSNYRGRITAWLIPPVTGNYTFWITSDDNSRLWLSTDHDAANATLVASVSGWAGEDNWTKFPEQQSDPVSLQGGKPYWLRGGYQEGGGGDHIRIGWASSEAGIADHTIIEGQYLWDTNPFLASAPSPDIGGFVHPGNVDLSWTNAEPTSGDEVRVEVWFGEDPTLIRITDPNLSETINMTTKTVNAPVPGTYYWRVYLYLDGVVHAESKVEGPLWWFIAKEDLPPVVDAGVDMITWQDQAVTLDPIIDDDEVSPLTYRWTAPSEPDVVVVFSDPNTLAPTVTIGISKPFFIPFVGNGGFEDPVLANGSETFTYPVWAEADYSLWEYRWYYIDDSYTSIRNPTIAADGFEAPEGENVGVAYTYPGYDYALTQILAETLQASTRYDLSVQVGNPGPYNQGVSLDYRVELWTGGNVGVRSFLYGSGEQTIDPNGWETVNLTYACGPSHEQLGEPLEIRLIAESYADGHAVYFDDVILSIDGKSGTFPPYHSVDLTLAVHDEDNPTPVEDTMTIDVYADKCMAAIGAGLATDAGDVNVDCMTNLKDIAEIAAAWLDVYSVTAPFEKL